MFQVLLIDGLTNIVKYARCISQVAKLDHNYIHFSCHRYKETTCLDTVPAFDLPLNYKIKEVNFLVSGICSQCL
jgi:Fur family ferric uptake transcriptional regulator